MPSHSTLDPSSSSSFSSIRSLITSCSICYYFGNNLMLRTYLKPKRKKFNLRNQCSNQRFYQENGCHGQKVGFTFSLLFDWKEKCGMFLALSFHPSIGNPSYNCGHHHLTPSTTRILKQNKTKSPSLHTSLLR